MQVCCILKYPSYIVQEICLVYFDLKIYKVSYFFLLGLELSLFVCRSEIFFFTYNSSDIPFDLKIKRNNIKNPKNNRI